MRSKKGFTLIELLAVIVILAVIALIATPIIMNVINDSKEGAAKDAMYGYVKAVELASAQMITSTVDAPSGENFETKDGNIYEGSTKILDVTFKGTKPANGGTVKLANGNVTYAKLEFDGITVTYNGKKAEVGESEPARTYTVGEEVYFDPTGTVTDCASGKEWKPNNTGTTCYKWNVVKDNGTTIEMLLDHSTTAEIAWNSSKSSAAGPLELYNQLKTDTNSWSKVEILTSADNVTRANASGGTYTINYNGMKARLISGQEVADIVGNTTWTPDGGDISLSSSWLYQNTYSNGDDSDYGYWTDTAHQSNSPSAWSVHYYGNLDYFDVNYTIGVRPAIRVLKSNI